MMLNVVVLATLTGLVVGIFDEELHAKYLSMPESEFIEYFNKQDFSWKMSQNNVVNEKHFNCAHLDYDAFNNLPLKTHNLEAEDLPENFDSRKQWPECDTIKEIYNQGFCGSCFTFGTATTVSDRECIHNGKVVRLSEQDFECMQSHVCDGGSPIEAFNYWKDSGLVTLECKPYDVAGLHENQCITECVNSNENYNEDKHFGDTVYRISNESAQIKSELVKNGPIQAGFQVYEDFKNYTSGIYEHKWGNWTAQHSVRVIGYGVENGIDYWLVANSWGIETWGDHGWFKIKSYDEDAAFEKYLIAGIPKK